MKLLTPKIFEMKETVQNNRRYLAQQQKSKEAFKYIAIYRKALRNSKVLSSSRTDLKIQDDNNEYDQDFMKTTYKQKLLKSDLDTDLLPTEYSHTHKSARGGKKYENMVDKSSDKPPSDYILPQITSCASNNMQVSFILKRLRS